MDQSKKITAPCGPGRSNVSFPSPDHTWRALHGLIKTLTAPASWRRYSVLFVAVCVLFAVPAASCAASPSNPGLAGLWEYPTADMPGDGMGHISYSSTYPYRTFSAGAGLFPWLEFNIRLTEYETAEIIDPDSGHPKVKALDLKLLLTDQESLRPAIAVGALDLGGSEIRKAWFAAGTWRSGNLALTLGYATDAYNGFYGGISWEPAQWIELKAEYSPLDYTRDIVNGKQVHPEEAAEKYNFGVVLKSEWGLNGSLSYQRGEEFCFGLSYALDLTKPVFGGKINRPDQKPIMTDWKDTDIEKMASLLQSELSQKGFGLRNTVVLAGSKKVHVAFENIGYSSQAEALARTIILTAGMIPWDTEVCSFSSMVRGRPVSRTELGTEQMALIRLHEFNAYDLSEKAVTWAPETRYGTLEGEEWTAMAGPGESLKNGAADIRVALAYEPRLDSQSGYDLMHRTDIDYIGRLRSSYGWEAYLKVRQPIENSIDLWREPEMNDSTRIWKGVISYIHSIDKNLWTVAEAGWLDENYFGGNLWVRRYFNDSGLWFGGRLSVVKERDFDSFADTSEYKRAYSNGSAYYDPMNGENDWTSGYWAEAGYHDSTYDADLTVRYGRFIDSDTGFRIDALRNWNDTSIGFYWTDTDRDSPGKGYTDAGMILHLPLSFWYAGHPSNTYWDQEFTLLSNRRLMAGTIPGAWMSPETLIGDLHPSKLRQRLAPLLDMLMRDVREKGQPQPEINAKYGIIQYLSGEWRIRKVLENN